MRLEAEARRRRHKSNRALAPLWAALALLALLGPAISPALDPGFAGRQPGHDHIYIGQVNLAVVLSHTHLHEAAHVHAAACDDMEGCGLIVPVPS